MEDKTLLEIIAEDVKELKRVQIEQIVIAAKQEENLKEHMRRTDLLEKTQVALKLEIEPIKNHVNGINYVFKAIGVLTAGITALVAIFKFIEFIFSYL